VGARIVAETFVRMLKRDGDSFMNVSGFTPSLPSSVPATFSGVGTPPTTDAAQSLYGSNSSAPAITTMSGFSVCSTSTVPSCAASTSGSRR